MMGLWADGWFYISSAGLLLSGILFFFLLGQYRACKSPDSALDERRCAKNNSPELHPVYILDEAPSAQVTSLSLGEPEIKCAATNDGGVALVSLQNIWDELTELRQELRALSDFVKNIKDLPLRATGEASAPQEIQPDAKVAAPVADLKPGPRHSPEEAFPLEKLRRGPVWPV